MTIQPCNLNFTPEVDGSIQRPRRWIHVSQLNCNQFIFADFINIALTYIERYPVRNRSDDTRNLLWDNLRSHKTAYVTNVIEDWLCHHNFRSADRPPYRPKIVPIEYCFCEISVQLYLRCRRDRIMYTIHR